MNQDFISKTRDFWTDALKKKQLSYPSESVVRFLANCRVSGNSPVRRAIDIGFGSGRHLGLLLREGYRTSGCELIQEAISAAKELYGSSPLLEELVEADFRTYPFAPESFDVILCVGSYLTGQDDLSSLSGLLRPGGRLFVDYRTPFSWFAGLGEELSADFYHLDERAGQYSGSFYYFPTEDSLMSQFHNSGLVCENFERFDWWKKNQSELHSWWIAWLMKEGR